jgi:hypothetical protein
MKVFDHPIAKGIMDNPNSAPASKWRDDNACTLDGYPAKIIGWKNDFATVARLDGKAAFEWAWTAVARIMEHNNRRFYS